MLVMRASVSRRLYSFTPYHFTMHIMRWLEARLNRVGRDHAALRFRGLLSCFIVVIASIVVGFLVTLLARQMTHGELLETIIVCMAFSARPVFDACWQLFAQMRKKEMLSPLLIESLAHPAADVKDEHSVARAVIESLYAKFCTEIVAPMLWYVLCGLPGLIACVTMTHAEQLIRKRGYHGALFGYSVRVVYLCMQLVPALISGMLVSLASIFIPSCHPIRAIYMMFAESAKLPGTPLGWTFGALSGALELALAGPRSRYALVKETPWIGGGSARPTVRDVARALFLYGICLQLVLLAAALTLYLLKHFG